MQCVINTLHTPKEDKRMKKAFIIINCLFAILIIISVYITNYYDKRHFNNLFNDKMEKLNVKN